MKIIYRHIMAILVGLALLVCTGCSNTTSGKTPSNYEQLRSLIGKPITEACKELGLDEAEVLAANERKEDYKLPDTVEFAGITWDVYLSFDWHYEVVLAFLYVKDYGSDTEQSAKDAIKLATHLVKQYGERENPAADDELNKLSMEALQEKIINTQYFTRWEVWNLDDQMTDAMRAFYEEYIRNYTGEYVPNHLLYEMNLKYNAVHEEFARLTLEYRFRALYF